jgi:hypothetical protein
MAPSVSRTFIKHCINAQRFSFVYVCIQFLFLHCECNTLGSEGKQKKIYFLIFMAFSCCAESFMDFYAPSACHMKYKNVKILK